MGTGEERRGEGTVAEELIRKEVPTQDLCSHAGFRRVIDCPCPYGSSLTCENS